MPSRHRRLARALVQLDAAIGGGPRKRLPRAVRPQDFNAIDGGDVTQAEVCARLTAREVAFRGVQPTDPSPRAGMDGDLGAEGIALVHRIEGSHAQPVAARGDVAEQAGGAANRREQQVDPAIGVDIATSQATRDIALAAEGVIVQRDVLESPRSIAAKELIALPISAPEGPE